MKKILLVSSLIVTTNIMAFGLGDFTNALEKVSQGSSSSSKTSAPISMSGSMTATDKQNLKKFRSLYIENDYYFRNVDTVKLQDPSYRKPLEDKLHQLQALLNPMRQKTFDRGVARADSDLKKIEDIFASANKNSKKLAASVGNIDEELAAMQEVFDKEKFDPRLLRDYITDETYSPIVVEEWAKRLKNYKALMPDMIKFLDKVRNNTLKGKEQSFQMYRHWFKNNLGDDIENAMLDKTRRWGHELHNGVYEYKTWKPRELKAKLKTQSGVKELMEKFDKGKQALENQKVFDKVMDGKYSAKTNTYIKQFKAYNKILLTAKKLALKNQRMPQAAGHNPKLLSLAKSLLPLKKLGKVSHMRVTQKLTHHKELKYGNGWYMVRWDVFAVAFVQKVGKNYFIRYAYFDKYIENKFGLNNGGKWYLHSVVEGPEILKSKIR